MASSTCGVEGLMKNNVFTDSPPKTTLYCDLFSKCSKTHVNLAEEMAKRLFEDYFSIQSIREGKEPTNFFWVGLRGQKEYSTVSHVMSIN